MASINEKLLSSMADLKAGQAGMASDVTHIKEDVEETKEGIKLVHGRINKVESRAGKLEGWRAEQRGKGKAWKIVGGIIAGLAALTTILVLTGVFN